MSNINNKNTLKIVFSILLLGLVLYNAYLYRNELLILSDVNDNSFQSALVDDASNILHQVVIGKASVFYIFDSFNERWNEGFALSSYYSHLPQAVIAAIAVITRIPPQTIFNIAKFGFLITLPISFFLAALILGQSYFFALVAAYISHAIFTDGMYGIDIASFLWRGWGLSSQLFAVFFLPLAFAYSYVYLTQKKHLGKAVLFNVILASCHSGIFLMAAFAYPIIVAIDYFYERKQDVVVRIGYFLSLTGLLLAYSFVPFFTQSNYRNFSYWDPIWKFNSYGIVPVISRLLNGELFDFGRFAVVTLLVIFGLLYGFISRSRLFQLMSILFVIYLCFFIGKSPFGPLIDKIPGLSEFHLHRFIVALQFAGVFLATYTLQLLYRAGRTYVQHFSLSVQATIMLAIVVSLLGGIIYLEKPIIKYAQDNSKWIIESNNRYTQDIANYEKLLQEIERFKQSRLYVGRPGNWGRDLKVGDTSLFMQLARDGYRTIGYSPESWSPNSEPDQFFDETRIDHFLLYNVGLAVYPNNITPPDFAHLVKTVGKYNLYEIIYPSVGEGPAPRSPQGEVGPVSPNPPAGGGWFTFGKSSLVLVGKKTDFANISHLWLYSRMFSNQNYPQIMFLGDKNSNNSKYYFYLHDLNNYRDNNGKEFSLWEHNPVNLDFGKVDSTAIKTNELVHFQTYSVDFTIDKDCINCIVILKQTYHPNWKVTVNGQSVQSYPVFPFYIGIPLEKSGKYHIEAQYKPNNVKQLLLLVAGVVILGLCISTIRKRKKHL